MGEGGTPGQDPAASRTVEVQIMERSVTKWMGFGAVLMFAAATFLIADDRCIIGAVCFGAAALFLSAAGIYKKKTADDGQKKKRTE